jgi:hypothetical protein
MRNPAVVLSASIACAWQLAEKQAKNKTHLDAIRFGFFYCQWHNREAALDLFKSFVTALEQSDLYRNQSVRHQFAPNNHFHRVITTEARIHRIM